MTFVIAPSPTTITFVFSLLFLLHNTTATINYFLDSKGNRVVNGETYKIGTFMPLPDEGPITWAKFNNSQPCPLNVILSHFPTNEEEFDSSSFNTSIKITSPINSKFIPLGAPVDIYFNPTTTITPCKKSLKWSIMSAKPEINAFYVVAGDVNRGYNGSFKFVNASFSGGAYYAQILVYCFNDKTKKSCLEVGNNAEVFHSNGILGVTSDPMVKRKLYILAIEVKRI